MDPVGDMVLKFYNAYRRGTILFVPGNTTIASFPVSQLSAAGGGPAYGAVLHPALTQLPSYTPPGGGTPIVGVRAASGGGTVYVYGWQSPDPDTSIRELYLARVSATRLTDFAAWRFYNGGQWAGDKTSPSPSSRPARASMFRRASACCGSPGGTG